MKNNITKYYLSAVKSSEYPVIPFKEDDFISVSYEDFLANDYGYIDKTHFMCKLLSESEIEELFMPFTDKEIQDSKVIEKCVNCAVAYKTLKTDFYQQDRLKKYIPELTGVYYFFFDVVFTRVNDNVTVKCIHDSNNIPWYSRSFMSPKAIKDLPDVAVMDRVNKYSSDNTYRRNQIKDNWQKYIQYVEDMFAETADTSLKYEDKCFIFKYEDMSGAVSDIENLYEKLLTDNKKHPLYDKFTERCNAKEDKLISNNTLIAMHNHCGQMNGKFYLADSQRTAVHHMNTIETGDILAVSGPPGTGKTTLLQSIVADMVVKCALEGKNPPIIVATSVNNQAVTNIIDSFSSINAVGISNLENRWIMDIKSFATYMPGKSRKNYAKEKGYQYTSIRMREFINDAEKSIDESVEKMKDNANNYFSGSFDSIRSIKNRLINELDEIDKLRRDLLSLAKEIDNFTNGIELMKFKFQLELSKKDTEKEINELKRRLAEWSDIYQNINCFDRILSFIPCFRKKISRKLIVEALPQESKFITNGITFDEICEKYTNDISERNNTIADIMDKLGIVQKLTEEAKTIIKQLTLKNCRLPLINNDHLIRFDPYELNNLIDTNVRYVEFWIAVHINECRFLEGDFMVTENQRGCNFKSVLERFYRQIALISPCFVMTLYKFPEYFYSNDAGYLFDFIDLLILDEAGQCSPEIAAASFSLAKKAIVVGDECQLQPVHNIDFWLDTTLALQSELINTDSEMDKLIEFGLSCSNGNVMRIAKKSCKYRYNDKIRGLFLSEHRRCYDEIIEYCNELVYDGLLIPLRNGDEKKKDLKRILNKNEYPLMGYYNISSDTADKESTSRRNEFEALQISQWLYNNYDRICDLYSKSNSEVDPKNILAIITPFSSQAQLIRQYLKAILKDKATNIDVGTVHTFQGGEKNIIIFSTTYGKADMGAFINDNKNLMNVAVSRAKDAFWAFGDIEFLKKNSPATASGLLYKKVANHIVGGKD